MTTTLEDLIRLAQFASYNDERKAFFKKHAMKFMRDVAKDWGLAKGQYDARFNPGGIAVSGDAILHTDNLYLHLNDFGFYWRKCDGRTAYSSRNYPNRQASGLLLTAKELVAEIQREVMDYSPKLLDEQEAHNQIDQTFFSV